MFMSWCSLFKIARMADRQSRIVEGYHIGTKIGKGMFSTVHLVQHIDHNGKIRNLACKIIDKRKCNAEFLTNFLPHELSILLQLDHPNVTRTIEILKRDQHIFIFMQYAAGGDLLQHIYNNGPMSEHYAKQWFVQLLKGIRYLHSIGIAHRDIKCENVFVTGTGKVMLGDFGFAKQFQIDRVNDRNRLSNTFCGSMAYAAPEVIVGNPYDPMVADIWSAGVVLFVMLNGKLPFRETNSLRLVKQQFNKEYRFNDKLLSPLSDPARIIIMAMLEANVCRRINLKRMKRMAWIRIRTPSTNATSRLK